MMSILHVTFLLWKAYYWLRKSIFSMRKKQHKVPWKFEYNTHNNNNRFTELCPGLLGCAGTRRNTHHPDYHPIFTSFFHLPRSIASSLFKLHAWQCFCTTSFHVLFRLPLGLDPSTSYSKHFFTQSLSSFRSTCPYHRKLFCCSINIISSIPSLSLNSLLGTLSFTLTLHIYLTILISARWMSKANLKRWVTNLFIIFVISQSP